MAIRHSLAAALVAVVLMASSASAQRAPARPGHGYAAHALTGGVPVAAVRGQLVGSGRPTLIIVNAPTPDSTALTAFEGGRAVGRLALPFPLSDDMFSLVDVDIPQKAPFGGPLERPHVRAEFAAPTANVVVLWDPAGGRWAAVSNVDGVITCGGPAAGWFGAVLEQEYAVGYRHDHTSPTRRADGAAGLRYPLTGGTVLRVERRTHQGVPDVHYRMGVYDGDIGPVQVLGGLVSVSFPDLTDTANRSCAGRPAVTDVTGDGHADFWLCDAQAASGHQSGAYRVYDAEAGVYVEDLAFAFEGEHSFAPDARRIREATSGTAGQYQTRREYDLSSGTPVLVWERTREPETADCAGGPACRARIVTRALRGGTMVTTEDRLGRPSEYLPEGYGDGPAAGGGSGR